MTIRKLLVDVIRVDGSTQNRKAISEETVEAYTELWVEAGNGEAPFPPCDVFYDGSDYWCADGFHRLFAAVRAKQASITCKLHQGTPRDAFLFGCHANARHGLRRSGKDKRFAVERMLADDEWRKLTQQKLAELAGVTKRYVQQVKGDFTPPKSRRSTSPTNGGSSAVAKQDPVATAGTVEEFDHVDEEVDSPLAPSSQNDESGPGDVECSRCSGSGRVPITAKMPAALSESAEFVNAWQDYQLFRIQKRSKLTTVGISRLFKKLESWGPDKATQALEITMENGWTGVFEPDQKGRASDDPRGNMATLEAYIAQL